MTITDQPATNLPVCMDAAGYDITVTVNDIGWIVLHGSLDGHHQRFHLNPRDAVKLAAAIDAAVPAAAQRQHRLAEQHNR